MLSADFDETSSKGRRPIRSTRLAKQPNYVEHGSSSSEEEEEEMEQVVKGRGKFTAPAKGLSTRKKTNPETSGQLIFNQLVKGASALKLVVDEWYGCWEEDSVKASLQVINLIFCSAELNYDLEEEELEHPDPAFLLAELQENWRVSSAASSAKSLNLLNPKNKSKEAKTFQRNFSEFWYRWAQTVSNSEFGWEGEGIEKVCDWLMVISSAAFRPLRMAATKACFEITRACCACCQDLSQELDQTNNVIKGGASTKTKTTKSSNKLVSIIDEISSNQAQIEKMIQKLFDGIFVQRFRDIDSDIRGMAVEYIEKWIMAYPLALLENSYLRYIGWALSDRSILLRLQAIESFHSLYSIASHRDRMSTFCTRFLPRLAQMAERDVEEAVRNRACALMGLLFKEAESPTEFIQEYLQFIPKIFKSNSILAKEVVDLIFRYILKGSSLDQFRKKASDALGSIKRPLESDKVEYPLLNHIAKFAEELCEGADSNERKALYLENFVFLTKRSVLEMRDIKMWIQYFEWELMGKVAVPKGTLEDRSEWESLFEGEEPSLSCILLLFQSIARYGHVFINSVPNASRQQRDGINLVHSQDLSGLIGGHVDSWINPLLQVADSDLCYAFVELVSLCDIISLQSKWPSCVESIQKFIPYTTEVHSASSLVNLLHYWANEEVEGALSMLSTLILNDINTLSNIAKGKGDLVALLEDGFFWRLIAVSAKLPLPDSKKICDYLNGLYSKLKEYDLEQNNHLDSEVVNILESIPILAGNILNFAEASDEALQDSCLSFLNDPFIHNSDAGYLILTKTFTKIALKNPSLLIIYETTIKKVVEFVSDVPQRRISIALNMASLYLADLVPFECLISLFFPYFQLPNNSPASKCFIHLFENCLVHSKDQAIALFTELMRSSVAYWGSENIDKAVDSLVSSFDKVLKKNNSLIKQDALIELNCRLIAKIQSQLQGQTASSYIERFLEPLCHHLSANFALELLQKLDEDLQQLNVPSYIKALRRVRQTRKIEKSRKSTTTNTTSRLREIVAAQPSSEAGSLLSSEPPSDANDNEQQYAGVQATTDQMEGLQMDTSEAPSSPILTRKRIINA